MSRTSRLIAALLVLFSATLFAQTTRTWEQSRFEDFEKGTATGVAIRSDGTLELAPALKQIAITPSQFIWAAATGPKGNLFLAAGSPARVYRMTIDGKLSAILAPQELQVQALAVDSDGVVYAATAPDGKVYKISPVAANAKQPSTASAPPPADAAAAKVDATKSDVSKVPNDPGYTSTVLYDPKQKYIWALTLDNAGRLYLGTGDKGEIYRVDKNGAGSVFFKSDETHIRSLAFAPNGDLIAGSDAGGLVYRITPDGKGFVLYSAPKKEITALAVDGRGVIYAAAAGDKKPTTPPMPSMPQTPAAPNAPGATPGPAGTGAAQGTPQIPVVGAGAVGSEVYRIEPDGAPKRIWSSRDELVYALTFDRSGHLLAGTGNKGRIFSLRDDGTYTQLQKATANQVIAFAAAPNWDLFAVTSNLGKVFLVQDAVQREGTFDSEVFDARMFSRWGHVEARTTGAVDLWARGGSVDNPDRNWSPWQKLDNTGAITAPAARFVQWRAVLHSGEPAARIEYVRVNYLPKNVPPEVDDVTVAVGSKIPGTPRTVADIMAAVTAGAASSRTEAPGAFSRDRDWIAVRWAARDENDDLLGYSVYYRGDGETRWQLLKDGLADRFYSFDSSLLPDGGYTMKVVATDAPSHTPGEAMTGAKESQHFEVDNTPPQITNLVATVENGALHVRFNAADAMSLIRRAEYSVDAGDWHFVAPVGGLSDAKTATYDFVAPIAPQTPGIEVSGEHVVVVRVYDRPENLATAKAVVRSAQQPARGK